MLRSTLSPQTGPNDVMPGPLALTALVELETASVKDWRMASKASWSRASAGSTAVPA